MGDFALLQAYANRGSEDAFAELVNRHIHLVHSAALRQMREPEAAAEVVQTVFLILARKAHTIRENAILPAWLLRTTRFAAANARRQDIHRQMREQQAMEKLHNDDQGPEPDWTEAASSLDAALARLKEKDRNAVVLRFFEKKSYKEIGDALFLTEDNARKRVARALEKLRVALNKEGATLSATALGAGLGAYAVEAAPSGLAGEVTAGALAKALSAPAALSALAQGTLRSMIWAQAKGLVLPTAFASLAISIAAIGFHLHHEKPAGPLLSAEANSGLSIHSQSNNIPVTPPASALAQNDPANGRHILQLSVTDAETGQPVPNARLTLTEATVFPQRSTNIFATDSQGKGAIAIDATPVPHWNIRIEVFKDGYVPKYVSWSAAQNDQIGDIPQAYETKLTPAIVIGGVVQNENGQSVPNARVVFSVYGSAPGASHDRERLTMMGNYHTEMTDSLGRWRCNHVPAQFGMIHYTVNHPDYVTATFTTMPKSPSIISSAIYVEAADLRNSSGTFVIQHGKVVAGQVIDPAGGPVAGAKITENHTWYEPSAIQRTGASGQFRFANAPTDRDLILTLQADGFAPAEISIPAEKPAQDLRLQMDKGALLEGRVVDEEGKPIADAHLHFADEGRFQWRTSTDADGSFRWASAPANSEVYAVEASGYSPDQHVELAADGDSHVVTLHRNQYASIKTQVQHFSGSVVDAYTGLPIDNFQVFLRDAETASGGNGPRGGKTQLKVVGKYGSYAFSDNWAGKIEMEIRADGYFNGQCVISNPVVGEGRFDFRLEPAVEIAAVAQHPDGSPAAKAKVYLCHEKGDLRMEFPGAVICVGDGPIEVETDADGKFSFKTQRGLTKAVAVADEGYAEIPIADLISTRTIIVRPWGRIRGTLKIGKEPGRGEIIEMHNSPWGIGTRAFILARANSKNARQKYTALGIGSDTILILSFQATTDDGGHFVFDKMPPGQWEMFHNLGRWPGPERPGQPNLIKLASPDGSYAVMKRPWHAPSHNAIVSVQAGQTTEIMLGGTGRTVVGRIRLPDHAQPIDGQMNEGSIITYDDRPEIPERAAFASNREFLEAMSKWLEEEKPFWMSPAGAEVYRNTRQYGIAFAADGSFKISDVPPGKYCLTAGFYAPADLQIQSWLEGSSKMTSGFVRKVITVPDDPSGGDALVDLGVFDLALEEAVAPPSARH